MDSDRKNKVNQSTNLG
jgi:hypothetical protein